MKKYLYIFSDSLIKRKDNGILVAEVIREDEREPIVKEEFFLDKETDIPTGQKHYVPLETIDSIFSFGDLRFNTKFMSLISQSDIILHLFDSYGRYVSSAVPPKSNPCGSILISQVDHYRISNLRQYIARQFVLGQLGNILSIVNYYNNRNKALREEVDALSQSYEYAKTATEIEALRGIEGNARKIYFSCWNKIIIQPVEFNKRTKHPPVDFINSLISYGNMVLYSICLSEIFRTKLYPEIGFIHEHGDKKHPLCYDIADIFKPVIVDRTIFKLMNKNMISEEDGKTENGYCRLSDHCKKLFIKEINGKLFTVINNPEKDARMCYKRIIREECYKLVKHLYAEEAYTPFKMPW